MVDGQHLHILGLIAMLLCLMGAVCLLMKDE
jgi:hypothetical protein